jgi:Flp pilus assembly protein TadG
MLRSQVNVCPNGWKRRGAAAVELAVLLPLLLFMSMVIVDFSRLVYAQVTIQNCARNGATYEFCAAAGTSLTSPWSSLSAAVTADAANLTVANITCSASSPGSSTNNYVTVTVTYPFTLISLGALGKEPAIPTSLTLTQTATMPYPVSLSTVY